MRQLPHRGLITTRVTDRRGYRAPPAAATAGDTLQTAILALTPSSYWPMREESGVTLNDIGTLENHATLDPAYIVIAGQAGPDGYSYPSRTLTNPAGITAPDDSAYTIGSSGLTIGFLVLATNTGIQRGMLHKAAEWTVKKGAFTNEDELLAGSLTSGGGAARQRYASVDLVAAEWRLCFIRWADNGATTYPTLRVNGTNHTGSTLGTSTPGGDSANELRIMWADGTPYTGAMGHVMIFGNTNLSDGDCQTIETAASALGFY